MHVAVHVGFLQSACSISPNYYQLNTESVNSKSSNTLSIRKDIFSIETTCKVTYPVSRLVQRQAGLGENVDSDLVRNEIGENVYSACALLMFQLISSLQYSSTKMDRGLEPVIIA